MIDCGHHSAFAAAIKFAPRLWKGKPPQGGFFMPEPYADVRYRLGADTACQSAGRSPPPEEQSTSSPLVWSTRCGRWRGYAVAADGIISGPIASVMAISDSGFLSPRTLGSGGAQVGQFRSLFA